MMDQAERELFAAGIVHAMASASGADLDVALDDLGWLDALLHDPRTTVATVFERQGASSSTSSSLEVVLASALGVAEPTGVVLPALGSTEPPGRVVDDGLAVAGLGTAGLPHRGSALVPAGAGLHRVELSALTVRPVEGLDPRLGLVEVTAEATASTASDAPVDWPGAVAAGQRALAHELVGASRTMLQLARDHAVERIQFDRPISQFQAVRHRLAESMVAIGAADAAAQAAWDDGTPLAAALAKAIAGRSARTVVRHCQQVLAGIGFTTEHPLHTYLRRVLVLDRLLGDARSLTVTLGEGILRTGTVPTLLPL